MGRWLSPDWAAKAEPVPYAKLSDPQSLNLYSYVRNNPLARVDVEGHTDWCAGKNAGSLACSVQTEWNKVHQTTTYMAEQAKAKVSQMATNAMNTVQAHLSSSSLGISVGAEGGLMRPAYAVQGGATITQTTPRDGTSDQSAFTVTTGGAATTGQTTQYPSNRDIVFGASASVNATATVGNGEMNTINGPAHNVNINLGFIGDGSFTYSYTGTFMNPGTYQFTVGGGIGGGYVFLIFHN